MVMLFSRDLRMRDNPALAAAARAARVVPLFVLDPAIRASDTRRRFLTECLLDLRSSLRAAGVDLVVRIGDPVRETLAVATEVDADGITLMADASRYARRREDGLRAGAGRRWVRLYPGVTVVPPGGLRPAGGDHYKIFTPYWRAWQAAQRRRIEQRPGRLTLPDVALPSTTLSGAVADGSGGSGGLVGGSGEFPGGETSARRRMGDWRDRVADFAAYRDHLGGDSTSRLSPYLHFGCVSVLELASRFAADESFVRQLCWRDFFTQLLGAFPDLGSRAYRGGAVENWKHDRDALAAWRAGATGVPIVDAGMRQLATEGWIPNRARLITASYLTKHLGIDWRDGAAWYEASLVDADVANNFGNWQWVAGTGTDAKPYRRFNPVRQAHRFDPEGEYVRRHVPEVAMLPNAVIHEPWTLDRPPASYPAPLSP